MSTICVIGDVHGHLQLALCMAARRQQEDGTWVVPLEDLAFPGKGLNADDPGEDAFCIIQFCEEITIRREHPDFWREYRRHKWKEIEGFGLVCPDLLDRK